MSGTLAFPLLQQWPHTKVMMTCSQQVKRSQQLDEHQSAKEKATAARQKEQAAEAAVVAKQEYEQKQASQA